MNIVIYTDEFCPRCKVLKTKLSNAGLEYKEINEFDEVDLERLGYEQLPVLNVDGEFFDYKEAIEFVNEYNG